MAFSRARAIGLLLVLVAAIASPAAVAAAPAGAERVVMYFDADNDRVRRAIDKVRRFLDRAGVTERHRVKLVHVPVDMSDEAAIASAVRRALKERPAALVTPNMLSARTAKSLTRDVPIIFGAHQDPVAMGLVDSLAHPGRNVTGFTFFTPIDEKRLELLRQLAPHARRLGVLVDHWWEEKSEGRDLVPRARAKLGFEPEVFVAETVPDLRRLLASPRARAMDAWYVPMSIVPFASPAEVLAELKTTGKPAAFDSVSFVEAGGLVAYHATMTTDEALSRIAGMTGLILEGIPPGEIPIERPQSFEIAVNVDTARRLGLAVPVSLLKRADRVVFDAR